MAKVKNNATFKNVWQVVEDCYYSLMNKFNEGQEWDEFSLLNWGDAMNDSLLIMEEMRSLVLQAMEEHNGDFSKIDPAVVDRINKEQERIHGVVNSLRRQ